MSGPLSAQKSPSRVQDRDEGIAGRNGREYCLPDEGNSMRLFANRKQKNELVARPVVSFYVKLIWKLFKNITANSRGHSDRLFGAERHKSPKVLGKALGLL